MKPSNSSTPAPSAQGSSTGPTPSASPDTPRHDSGATSYSNDDAGKRLLLFLILAVLLVAGAVALERWG